MGVTWYVWSRRVCGLSMDLGKWYIWAFVDNTSFDVICMVRLLYVNSKSNFYKPGNCLPLLIVIDCSQARPVPYLSLEFQPFRDGLHKACLVIDFIVVSVFCAHNADIRMKGISLEHNLLNHPHHSALVHCQHDIASVISQ